MIRKSAKQFSGKIMRRQNDKAARGQEVGYRISVIARHVNETGRVTSDQTGVTATSRGGPRMYRPPRTLFQITTPEDEMAGEIEQGA
ncbi:hypothetical protein G5V57_15175 [Nordella sp. HKS 07]|uniref:hypothetical protein n=1 Tax=Nordella sp. HKS 07 TaxID=2712222 RepID=UPI0013E1CC30|nr:hypothetical protein [Nordella sp. HKS 07]QIG48947.1 hypothetical protein G5V57_15175 [Nordella sp. HKS 07]